MLRYWVDIDDRITFNDNNWRIPINMFHGNEGRLDMSYGIGHLVVIF